MNLRPTVQRSHSPAVPLLLAGLAFLLVRRGGLAAQSPGSPRNITFGSPIAVSADPFTLITSVRALSNGRVLVSDAQDQSVQLVDLAGGEAMKVGREGQGPGEYSFPGDLLAVGGDTTWLVDRVNRRFLIILPNGKTGDVINFPSSITGIPQPRGVDRAGRVYFAGSPFPGQFSGTVVNTPDSVPVLRWDRRRDVIDTVAMVRVPSLNAAVSGGSSSGQVRVMMRSSPLAPADDWGLAPQGTVGVARVGDYHIEWYDAPRHRAATGTPVHYDRLRVTDADKEEYRRLVTSSRGPRMVIGSGGTSTQNTAPAPAFSEPDWPEFKPPFQGRAVWITPEGDLWVLRTRVAGDSVPVLDVFNQQGQPDGQVTLPRARRLAGFGPGSIYLVRTDSDDLQWLEKYRR